ncbi:uncharacterized protein N7446_005377 [Penicillium canescens]|uniref:Uncharacterized protein n=1 Tax=Penicillium canescens TaxID=5083 RepID=A0AAD6IAQ3_PENCN|nr:uncharacterized protein N7446_005377 [Penicillium canescens]KAJ6038574.1 hypothetical protein N7460_008345 [Penicillium canescens]KAJ6068340.1 hypothetical protein N7446_005377 [Penicillium canescens]
MTWTMVTSSTTTMLLYGRPFLTQWEIGLCSFQMALAASGLSKHGLAPGPKLQAFGKGFRHSRLPLCASSSTFSASIQHGTHDFPGSIRAKLRVQRLAALFCSKSCGATHPTAPVSFTATVIFNINSAVRIDCFLDRPASATALSNQCRCILGVEGASVINH